MDFWAVIPVKPFRSGKSRLASLLGIDERAALHRRLFGRVLDVALQSFHADRVVVVTADTLLLALMRGQGLHVVEDEDGGLNAALGLATRYVLDRGARTLTVLPGDLPQIARDDIVALKAALESAPGCVIVPDEQERGTNALALAPPDPEFFRFGAESFQAHLAAAKERGLPARILRRPGLAVDLDTPECYRRHFKEQKAPSGAMA